MKLLFVLILSVIFHYKALAKNASSFSSDLSIPGGVNASELLYLDNGYFEQAMKELDDMNLAKFDNDPDDICKPFCDHLQSKYSNVQWSCFCAKLDQGWVELYAPPFYFSKSNGQPKTSRVWDLKVSFQQHAMIYVGASRDTGRDLRDEYWRCRDKHNLYISTWTDAASYTDTLVNKLAECVNNYDTIVAMYNGPNIKSVWYGHGNSMLKIPDWGLGGIAQYYDKEYKIIANHRDLKKHDY